MPSESNWWLRGSLLQPISIFQPCLMSYPPSACLAMVSNCCRCVCIARNARQTLMFVVCRFPHRAFGWAEVSVVRLFAQRCLYVCSGQDVIVTVHLRVQSSEASTSCRVLLFGCVMWYMEKIRGSLEDCPRSQIGGFAGRSCSQSVFFSLV